MLAALQMPSSNMMNGLNGMNAINGSGNGSRPVGDLKTLWVGDIEPWMDEIYLLSMFAHTRDVVQVKVIRDKSTGLSAGYGFVEFQTHEAAKRVLETHNGQPVPSGSGKLYRLNWASYGINERKPDTCEPEYSIFVGDLAPDINDYTLQQVFAEHYPSVKSAKVVTDAQTGLSRGYGFVRFGSEHDMQRAMSEMQGRYCGSRPMRINTATPKRSEQAPMPPVDLSDPTNTTVFIGGLDPTVTESDLKRFFSPFGDIVYVKIPYGKGCGFVQYTTRQSAEAAFTLHGSYIGNQKIRLSWGRSASSSSPTHSSHAASYPFAGMPPQNRIVTAAYTPSPYGSYVGAPSGAPLADPYPSSLLVQQPHAQPPMQHFGMPQGVGAQGPPKYAMGMPENDGSPPFHPLVAGVPQPHPQAQPHPHQQHYPYQQPQMPHPAAGHPAHLSGHPHVVQQQHQMQHMASLQVQQQPPHAHGGQLVSMNGSPQTLSAVPVEQNDTLLMPVISNSSSAATSPSRSPGHSTSGSPSHSPPHQQSSLVPQENGMNGKTDESESSLFLKAFDTTWNFKAMEDSLLVEDDQATNEKHESVLMSLFSFQ